MKYKGDCSIDIAVTSGVYLEPDSKVITVKLDFDIRGVIPDGYFGMLYARSSWARRGLQVIQVPVDSGYTGKIRLFCYNVGEEALVIAPGECPVQLVIIPYYSEGVEVGIMERGDNWNGSTNQIILEGF